jgi:hypothetical protein
MDMECRFGQMDQNMKVIGKMMWHLAMVNFIILMETFMRDNGPMIKLMVLESTDILMVLSILELGKKINKKAKESSIGLMVQNMLEVLKMQKSTGKVCFSV